MGHQAESEIDPAAHDAPTATANDQVFWQAKAANAIDDNWLQVLQTDAAAEAPPVTADDLTSPGTAVELQPAPIDATTVAAEDAWFMSLSDDLLPER